MLFRSVDGDSREEGVVAGKPTPEAAICGVHQRRIQDDGTNHPASAPYGRMVALLPARQGRSWPFFPEAGVERYAHTRFFDGRSSSTSSRDSKQASPQVAMSPVAAQAPGRRGRRCGGATQGPDCFLNFCPRGSVVKGLALSAKTPTCGDFSANLYSPPDI